MALRLLNTPKPKLRLLGDDKELKKPKLFDLLTDATIATEGLIKGQTPLRDEKLSAGGRETSRFKDTVQGYPIDWGAWESAPDNRKNFYYTSEEDKPKVINQQYKNYIQNPEGYGLSDESPLEDVIKTFDKQRPENKINYLEKLGVDVKTKIKDLSGSFDLSALNPFSVGTAEASEPKPFKPRLRLLNNISNNNLVTPAPAADFKVGGGAGDEPTTSLPSEFERKRSRAYLRLGTPAELHRRKAELVEKGKQIPRGLKGIFDALKVGNRYAKQRQEEIISGAKRFVGMERGPVIKPFISPTAEEKKSMLEGAQFVGNIVKELIWRPLTGWYQSLLKEVVHREANLQDYAQGKEGFQSLPRAMARGLLGIEDVEGREILQAAGLPKTEDIVLKHPVLAMGLEVWGATLDVLPLPILKPLSAVKGLLREGKYASADRLALQESEKIAKFIYEKKGRPIEGRAWEDLPQDFHNVAIRFVGETPRPGLGGKSIADMFYEHPYKSAQKLFTQKLAGQAGFAKIPVPKDIISQFKLASKQVSNLEKGILENIPKAAVAAYQAISPKTEGGEIDPLQGQPKAGGLVHDLSPKEREMLKGLKPDAFKIVTLDRDVEVKMGNETKKYKKGENIYIYQDNRTGKAIVKDGDYGILPKKEVTKVEQAGYELKVASAEEKGVEEVWKGGVSQEMRALEDRRESGEITIDEYNTERGILRDEGDITTEQRDTTKFSQYQTPGGENYRELLLKATQKIDESTQKEINEIEDYMQLQMDTGQPQAITEQLRDRLDKLKNQTGGFKSSHFDEPNILAHIRMNDRTVDGKKILFVEEIQSDWAKAGREKGFIKKEDRPSYEEMEKDANRRGFYIESVSKTEHYPINREGARGSRTPYSSKEELLDKYYDNIVGGKPLGVPFHPSLKNWHELAMKKILEVAVREGYDGISWTTGGQQAERYSLEKQLNSIGWYENTAGRKQVNLFPKEGKPIDIDVGLEGKIIAVSSNASTGWIGKRLDDVIGKGIAEKVNKETKGKISGQDLKIGGESLKNLYDRMIPQALKKLTKGEVGKVDLGLKGLNYLNMDVAEKAFIDGKTVIKEYEDGTDSEVIEIGEIQTATSGEKFYLDEDKNITDIKQPFLELTPQIKERIIGQPKAGGLPTGPKTLTGMIQQGGGIDFSKDYNVKEMKQFGLKNTPGARTPDDWAASLVEQGLLQVPEGANPGDHLIEQLKVKKLRLIAPRADKTVQREFFEAEKEAALRGEEELEFDTAKYDKEAQAELVKQISAVQKKAGKPSVLRTNDVKRVIRQETGQNKVRDLVAIPEAKALESQLEREAYTAKIAYKEGIEKGVVLSQEDINKIEAKLAKEQFRSAEERLAAEMGYKRDIVREKRFGKEKLNKFKAHQLEVSMRKRARIAARTKIKDMIADIKGIDTSKMRPEFAAPVKELKDSMDFTKRTEKTLTKLAMTTKYLVDNPEADIPQYVLDKVETVQRKNISDITLEEFEALHTTIMHYAHLNKLKNTIIREQRERRIQDVIEDAKTRMKPRKEVDIKNIEDSDKSSAQKFGDKLVETFGVRSEHLDLVVETVFGGTDSEAYKVLFDDINNGQRKALSTVHNAEEMVSSGLEELDFARHGIKDINKWLRKKVEIKLTGGKRFNVSRGKKLSILKHYANDKNFTAIVDGGITFKDAPTIAYDVTPEDLEIIVNSATEAERDFIAPTNELFEIQHDKLNEVHVKTKGYALPKEENYFPIERGLLGKKFLEEQDILEQFKNKFVRIGLWKGMLKSRVKSKLPVVLRDVDEVIAGSVFSSSAYIGLEEALSNASKLLYSPEFRAEIENRYGRSTWKYLDKAMRDIAGEHKSYTSVEDILLNVKNRITPPMLGLNPFVMGKQVASYVLYNIYVDAPSLTQGFIDYRTQRSSILKKHRKYSPQFREREKTGYARDVADVLKRGSERRFTGGKKTIQQKQMGGILLFDKETVAAGMEGAIIQKLKELKGNTDLTPEQKLVEAYKWADRVTSITQPMFDPQFRSDISRGSATEKLWTFFSTQLNQNLNILRRTWRDAKRTGDYGTFAHALFLVVVVNGSMIYMIDRARDKLYRRAKEASLGEWLLAMVSNSASMFYFIREAASSLQHKLKYGTFLGRDVNNPILSVMDLLIDTTVSGIEMFTKDEKEQRQKSAKKFIEGAKQAIFTYYGIAYYTPRKLLRTLMGLEEKQRKKKKGKLRLL